MREIQYSLEKYRGSRSRYTCPNCHQPKQFVRYIDKFGDYIDETVGRCNRNDKCGYHRKPKEFFEMFNVQSLNTERSNKKNTLNGLNALNRLNTLNDMNTLNKFDTIDKSFVVRSLEYTAENRFINFLLSFIDEDLVSAAVKKYFVGSTKDGRTAFWLIDREGRARTGKIISYREETGKRDKSRNPSWIHYELKKAKAIAPDFEHRLCWFGEHLLAKDKEKPVAVVEAEKTAVIASIFLDKFLWLAVGSKDYLKPEKLNIFGKRKIVLFPDLDGFEKWKEIELEARKMGLNVSTSELLEKSATDEERASKDDLADYLIRIEKQAQEFNSAADDYNAKLDRIKNDPELFQLFNEILDERIAIMESEEEATKSEHIRAIVERII